MSNRLFVNVAIFTVGAVVGSAVTWKLLKTKYERLAQEEIDSVKELFFRHSNEIENEAEKQQAVDKYNDIVETYSSTNSIKKAEKKPTEDTVKDDNIPYVISPEEFGELGYEVISLTYYEDNVLADDIDNIIDNPSDVVGPDALNSFGEFEDDSVFVRDDMHKIDYEIIRSLNTYSEVVGRSPRRVEGK